MKSKNIIPVTLAIGVLCGCNPKEQTAPSPVPLWSQMQDAVLQKQDLREVQRILDAGFDVNAPIGCGTFSPVDGAVGVGNVAMLKMLLSAGGDPKGEALLQAAFYPKPNVAAAMVQTLLDAGADMNFKEEFPGTKRQPGKKFSTALHKACYRGHVEVVRLLLNRPGIEIDLVDVDGRTPLMWAYERQHEKIVQLFQKKITDLKTKDVASEGSVTSASSAP